MKHFAWLLLLAACSGSPTKFLIVPASDSLETDSLSWVEGLRGPGVQQDRAQMESALRLSLYGDWEKAKVEWRALAASTDTVVRQHAVEALGHLHFHQNAWTEWKRLSVQEHGDSVLASAFEGAPQEIFTIPDIPDTFDLQTAATGTPTVEVTINGIRRRFLLDTGAGLTVLASDVAEACGVHAIGARESRAGTATSRTVAIRPAVIDEFRIGSTVIRHHPAIILDKRDLEFKLFGLFRLLKIDGLIGWNAIRQLRIVVDGPKRKLHIGRSVASTEPRNFFWAGYPFVRAYSVMGEPIHFGFDTGANRSCLSDSLPDRLKLRTIGQRTARVGSAGGFDKIQTSRIDTLQVRMPPYDLYMIHPETRPGSQGGMIRLDGTIGSDWLAGRRVVIDFPAGRLETPIE